MSFDISQLLDGWEYQPGQVMVRRFVAADGLEKIQLRVDLGLLQMNVEGRPDGKRPNGCPSLWEFFAKRLAKHQQEHDGNVEDFTLSGEDCSRLQMEALQYHHRCICLLQLNDFSGVVRDTERNLEVFNFVNEHAESDEMAWGLIQFRPQVVMIHTRALAAQVLATEDYPEAIRIMEEGIEDLRGFFRETDRPDLADNSAEILSLEDWLSDLRAKRPLSQRERLEQALADALQNENYEKAAQVRDALRKLESRDSAGK
ncbi:MAG: hypothetical protein WCO56_10360 [Verrucomicrobiota bacterium]